MLPHSRELIEFQPLADLYTIYKDHERLTVFANKGRVCVTCGRVGTLLVLSRETANSKYSRKRKSVGWEHIDLYTDDFVLMTVDHITPKEICKLLGLSEEETESLENKQPMCEHCNQSKGSKPISNEQLAQNRKNARPVQAGFSTLRLIVPNIHRLLDDYAVLDSPQ
jgi:5-methylcytosine-specific restriction endonuclease McrA